MITFEQFQKMMLYKSRCKHCIEILFSVNGSEKFDNCWMGKTWDKKLKSYLYWFGLTTDGKNTFDYRTFEDLSSANVFDGKSLFEIWNRVNMLEIDGCDPMERISFYIEGDN